MSRLLFVDRRGQRRWYFLPRVSLLRYEGLRFCSAVGEVGEKGELSIMRLSQSSKKLSENHMKTRALGFLLMAIGACTYAVGCGSSNNSGTGGAAAARRTGGRRPVAWAEAAATPDRRGRWRQGRLRHRYRHRRKADTGTDTATDRKADTATDRRPTPTRRIAGRRYVGRHPGGADVHPGLRDPVGHEHGPRARLLACHDGVIADGGAVLPHSMDFSTKAAAYTAFFGVNSLRCAGADGGSGPQARAREQRREERALSEGEPGS